jgi:uncharacterized protein (DUF1501 family)
VVPYAMSTEGSITLTGTWGGDGTRRLQTLQQLFANQQPQVMQREIANLQEQAIVLDGTIRSSLAAAPALSTQFPSTNLGQQLRMVARMISAREGLGAARQVYFVRQGGYDTHANQLGSHPALLAELSGAMVAFQAAMTEVGVNSQVTTCTMSEFGRTLTSNANGSDHGWGGHQMIMGGSVQGRRIYGTMPNLALNSPDDCGLGRIIPTTAVDQYAATMAKWFGVSAGSMNSLFPRLSQFASPDLGFLV